LCIRDWIGRLGTTSRARGALVGARAGSLVSRREPLEQPQDPRADRRRGAIEPG
jgi:hypothetical protein